MRLALLLLFAVACATAPVTRALPPPGAWAKCDGKCDDDGATFIGLLFPNAFVPAFVCVCSLRPGPEPEETALRGR